MVKTIEEKAEEDDLTPDMASEIFEHAHFVYGTQSIEETVRVLNNLDMGYVAKKALGEYAYSKLKIK